jgi:hypothetical protein
MGQAGSECHGLRHVNFFRLVCELFFSNLAWIAKIVVIVWSIVVKIFMFPLQGLREAKERDETFTQYFSFTLLSIMVQRLRIIGQKTKLTAVFLAYGRKKCLLRVWLEKIFVTLQP